MLPYIMSKRYVIFFRDKEHVSSFRLNRFLYRGAILENFSLTGS